MGLIREYAGKRPRIGERVYLAETAAVIGDVLLGDDVSVWYNTVLRGDCHSIRVGARSNIQDNCAIHVTQGKHSTEIEEEVTLGHGAIVHGAVIRSGALIGIRATVLDGAVIGESAFVGAGALVTPRTVVPPRTLWLGAPARQVRALTDAEVEELKHFHRNYLEYKKEYFRLDGVGVGVSTGYRAVKGTRDLFPPESERFADAEAAARRVFGSYGYGEVRTPCLESTELFARSVGETTDLVHKEMYTFFDKKGRSLTLRPENTAGVVRAVIENGLAGGPMPLRLWYAGPQFRYERPQAGRYREFRQIGAELLGVPGPAGEVEILTMLFAFLKALGFQSLSVALNSVGTAASREAFGKALRAYLEPRSSGFGEDDRRKLSDNPLRLFDSRDPVVRAALEGSPRTLEYLDDDSKRHHDEVRRLLTAASIPFRDEPSLVRGLDYYTRTVFEVVSADLGAQDAILGGGRYDNLVAALGGPALPAIGFAIGEDRLVQAAPRPSPAAGLVLLLPQGPEDVEEALRLADELRAALTIPVEVDLLARGFKKGMARGNALFEEASARGLDREKIYAVLLGPREREAGTVTFKRLASGEQESVPRAQAAAALKGRA